MSSKEAPPVGEMTMDNPPSTTPAAETTTVTKPSSTLYPKIGKISDFIHKLKKAAPEARVVPISGTVKLHGAHADWVITNDDIVRVQSRSVLELSSSNDSYGLFAFTSPLHAAIIRLRDDIVRRYQQLNPNVSVDPDYPTIISGEWCGKGIQKGVAISHLPKHFVIISIRVNDVWVDEKKYADIHDEANGIFHISKAGDYRLDYDLDLPEVSDIAIQRWVKSIEKSCPYGVARGVQGSGEGIVWKAVDYIHDPDMWFKSKAESHTVSNSSKLSKSAIAPENREREDNFAKAVVTERRLEQGWEYLRETGVTRNLAATGRFVAWITSDVLVEEEQEMAQNQIHKGKLRPSIKSIAEAWYKRKLSEASKEDHSEIEEITEQVKNVET
ncbi:MAG: hypothetical protein LQ338_003339 [Usnochroma carphineum]|nr:MAG: hypothetical protein LQ338_003339 [Usnochroma carphineum]